MKNLCILAVLVLFNLSCSNESAFNTGTVRASFRMDIGEQNDLSESDLTMHQDSASPLIGSDQDIDYGKTGEPTAEDDTTVDNTDDDDDTNIDLAEEVEEELGEETEDEISDTAKEELQNEICQLMEPLSGTLHPVTWTSSNHGPNGRGSSVWVIPTLYDGVTSDDGSDYEFSFRIYWDWKRERNEGITLGTPIGGEANAPVGIFGAGRRGSRLSWASIVNMFGGYENATDKDAFLRKNDCLKGKNCDSWLIMGRVKNIDSGTCELETSANRFRKRYDGGGCFTPWTEIRLADGSTKALAKLNEGELVWNPIKKAAYPVKKLISGAESVPMIRVIVGSKSVIVTHGHPFLTSKGLVKAADLRVGDELASENHRLEKVAALDVVTNRLGDLVMNLELDTADDHSPEAHMVEASGIATGDLYLQQKLAKDDLLKLTEKRPEQSRFSKFLFSMLTWF